MPLSSTLCSQIYSSAFPSYVGYCKRPASAHLISQACLPSSFWVDLANGRGIGRSLEQEGGGSPRISSPPSLLWVMADTDYEANKY